MVSVSGVRGIAGESVTPALVERYVGAFGALLLAQPPASPPPSGRPLVVLGRDSRVSGAWIEAVAAGVLQACGLDVRLAGVVPTPTVQLLVLRECRAVGGLVVTSSHNPAPWNGLKFVAADGLFLAPARCKELFAAADAGQAPLAAWDQAGAASPLPDAPAAHVEACLALPYVPVEEIKAKAFKVALDTVNGAGGPTMARLLEALGCTVVGLNLEASGIFAHSPEPIPQHLGQLCEAVVESGADFGIAVDPDVDRCVLIDEQGRPLGEEYTLGIAVEFLLGPHVGKRGPVVRNLSTSRVVDDVAAKYGCTAHQSAVGEIHVAQEMLRVAAVVGGEGNGGVMLPDLHIGRDAPVAATLALSALAKFGGTMSGLKAALPQYEIVKQKVPLAGVADPDAVLAALRDRWAARAGARVDERDGIRVDFEDWWVHVRRSNTEPVVRIIAEAPTAAAALERCNQFAALLA